MSRTITVKSMKTGVFTVEADPAKPVRELKEAIYAARDNADDLHPDAQKLIYSGKLLKDADVLADMGFKDSDFVVVMGGKRPAAKKKESDSSSDEPKEKKEKTQEAPSTPAETAAPTSSSNPPRTETPESSAPETTVEGLSSDSPLVFLNTNPAFNQLRAMVHQNPLLLPGLLKQLAQSNPDLVQALNDNKEDFYRLINSQPPAPQMGMDMGMGAPQPQQGRRGIALQLTPEEREAITRLMALGFDEVTAAQAYIACEKNEMAAANWLLEHGME